jgi:NitT/TauT family transport system permease protein
VHAFPNVPLETGRSRFLPNLWDVLAVALLFGAFVAIAQNGRETLAPLATIEHVPISLAPTMLPHYAVRTLLRMLAAMFASLVFTLVYATLAAKSRRAEMVLIPLLDILQSVPILGFLSFTVAGFMAVFPGQVLGVECAAVFAIFTSQAWNMAFSLYQSLKTVPREPEDVCASFRLTPWQRFWRLEVPFAIPGLVWNMMMSMSGGWFFVVASEAISVGDTTVMLPGVGSYVAAAIQQKDLLAVGWAVLTMLLVIVGYDRLMFRPLVAWSEKFRFGQSAPGIEPQSWLLALARRTRLLRFLLRPLGDGLRFVATRRLFARVRAPATLSAAWSSQWLDRAWITTLVAGTGYLLWSIGRLVGTELDWQDAAQALLLGVITMSRVIVLIGFATLLWVPIGVRVGLDPQLAEKAQPLAQLLAAFPANIAFPFVVHLIVHLRIDPDIWLSPLMILGTQWYILFNVIAGASVFPRDLQEAAASFRVRGWKRWRKVLLPGIFPYYVTGAITASGGAGTPA